MTLPPEPGGPLRGVRVLDMGTMIAGPISATILGDFGADVIKVELPGSGDPMRYVGADHDGVNLSWLVAGRNKRSVTLDLRLPEGRALLLSLVREVDVLIENFRPGTLDAWGITELGLRAANPRLVVLRISGYGQTGPKRSLPGFDAIALAYAGVTYLTGYPESPPSRAGVAVADYTAAYNGALAVVMALYHRDAHGGSGQTIDLSLFETVFGMTRELVMQYELTGEVRERCGNGNPLIVPSGCFRTLDEVWLIIAGSNDNIWRKMAAAMGRDDLGTDPGYATNAARIDNERAVNTFVERWMAGRTAHEVETIFQAAGVPVTRVYSAADIADDDHYRERGALETHVHPKLGAVRIPGVAARLSETPGAVRSLGSDIGEHNAEIYGGLLGLSAAELEKLAAARVI